MASLEAKDGSTSVSLLRRARSQDPRAWSRLTRLYGPLVAYWCRQAGLKASDSADVLQEVFLAVFNGLSRFEPGGAGGFRGWLHGICRHKILDHRRKRTGIPTEGLADLPDLPEPPDDSSQVHADWLVHRVVEMVEGEFEPTTWRAFWLTAVEDRPAGDVGAELGLSRAAVYQARSRVVRRLRAELDGLV